MIRRLQGKLMWCALVAGVALTAAACGSGGSGTKSASGGTSAAAASNATPAGPGLSGPPVKFGLLGDLTVAGADSHPDSWKMAQIAAAAINASGGIKGRPLQLVVCDSKQDPQTAVLCGQQLIIQDKVVAMVGSFDTEENGSLYPALQQANTIDFGGYPSSPQDNTSPRSYPIASGGLPFLSEPKLLPPGTKKVAIVYGQSAPTEVVVKSLQKELPAGVKATLIGLPATGVLDMSPYCLQLQQSGANVAMSLIAESVINQLLSTCKEKGVTNVTWLMTDFSMNSQTVKELQAFPAPKVLLTFAGPAMTQMQQQVAKYGKQFGNPDDVTGLSKNSWLAVTVAANIFRKLPTVSGVALQNYLNQQTALVTGGTSPLNFTKPGPYKPFPRIVNGASAPGSLKNGQLVQTGPFFNLFG